MATEFDPKLLDKLFTDLTPRAPTAPQAFEMPPPPPPDTSYPPRVRYFFEVLGLTPKNAAILGLQYPALLQDDEFFFLEGVYSGLELSEFDLQRLSDITERIYYDDRPQKPEPKRVKGHSADLVLVDDAEGGGNLAPVEPVVRERAVQELSPASALDTGAVTDDWFEKK